MKVLLPYKTEKLVKEHWFSENSCLVKLIKKNFDLTITVFDDDMSEEDKAQVIREYDVLLTMWDCSQRACR